MSVFISFISLKRKFQLFCNFRQIDVMESLLLHFFLDNLYGNQYKKMDKVFCVFCFI